MFFKVIVWVEKVLNQNKSKVDTKLFLLNQEFTITWYIINSLIKSNHF